MLVQFTVTNFKSFGEATTISMVPAPHVTHTADQVIETGVPTVPQLLRVAVVYGPNGAGKSNLVQGMRTLWAWLLKEPVRVRPNRLTPLGDVTSFELELIAGQRHFAYGLRIRGGNTVTEEWLTEVQVDGERTLFHRGDWPWADAIEAAEDIKPALSALAKSVSPQSAFFHIAGWAQLGDPALVLNSLKQIVFESDAVDVHEGILLWFAGARRHTERLLQQAGAGEVQIWFAVDEADDFMVRTALEQRGVVLHKAMPAEEAITRLSGLSIALSLRLMHPSRDGTWVPFDMDEESDGTRRILTVGGIHYAGTAGSANEATHAHAIIDEIERSLHPLVTRQLLAAYLSSEGRAQLLCTTHDSNLLDRTLLPADSIWFAQKNPAGETRLYSLAEFDPTELAALSGKLEEGYLNGRFGAIPFFANADRLGWSAT